MAGFTVYEINPQPEHEGACSTLVGQELTGKKGQAWKVIQKIERKKNSSGGRFSVGYLVEDSKGDKAFMKATDTSLLAGASDPAAALQEATSEHLFERQILDFCQGSNMDKIVHAVDYGDTTIIHNSIREWVFFIIFELADGDSRSIIDKDIRLLCSPFGPSVAQIGALESNTGKIAKAISWIRENYAAPMDVGSLAKMVNMSESSFHRHFKSVTSMSPVQFQKILRLQEAKNFMLSDMMDVTTASQRVGYASSSQFSREYSRLFGSAPSKDLAKAK